MKITICLDIYLKFSPEVLLFLGSKIILIGAWTLIDYFSCDPYAFEEIVNQYDFIITLFFNAQQLQPDGRIKLKIHQPVFYCLIVGFTQRNVRLSLRNFL